MDVTEGELGFAIKDWEAVVEVEVGVDIGVVYLHPGNESHPISGCGDTKIEHDWGKLGQFLAVFEML